MLAEEQIKRWVADGIVTSEQGEKMLATLPDHQLEGTLAKSRGVGSLLLLSSALLSGIVIFLFAFLYDVDASAHAILLLWMLCVAPMVYVLRQTPITILFSGLFFAWVAVFAYGNLEGPDIAQRLTSLPLPYLAAGVALFAIGGTHYLHPRLTSIARAYRIMGLQAVLVALLALGLNLFEAGSSWRGETGGWSLMAVLVILAVFGVGFTILNMKTRAKNPKLTVVEGPISLALLALVFVYALVPLPAIAFEVLLNLVLLALVGSVLVVGYGRRDLRLVNISSAALLAFVLLRTSGLLWGELSLGTFLVCMCVVAFVSAVSLVLLKRKLVSVMAKESEREKEGTEETNAGMEETGGAALAASAESAAPAEAAASPEPAP